MRRVVVLVVSASALVAGCTAFGYVSDPLDLNINNTTTLTINLVVNGVEVGTYPPGSHEWEMGTDRLPRSPWHVEAKTPSGRVLLEYDVKYGDVWHTETDANGHSQQTGKAARADLSCGRLDVWSGPPMLGPAPSQRFPPGDCDP